MYEKRDGHPERVDVPARGFVTAAMHAPRWLVITVAVIAGAGLLTFDRLLRSDAHSLLGFFVIVSGMTWAGCTVEAIAAAGIMLGLRTYLDIDRMVEKPPLALIGVASAILLLALGIVATRTLRRLVLQMDQAARRDPLTELLNSRAFQEVAERERARAERTGNPISIAFLDLDRFKQINDAHGHVIGNTVLTTVGEIITTSVRASDIVGRVGGDEFTLLLPDTDQFEVNGVLQRIRHRLAMRTDIPLVTVTIGYVTFMSPPGSVAEMVQMADDLMYKSKRRAHSGGLIGKVVGARPAAPHTDPSRSLDITTGRGTGAEPSRATTRQ